MCVQAGLAVTETDVVGHEAAFHIAIGKWLLLAGFAVGPVSAAETAQAPAAANPADPDQVIKCRKYQAPGSLVRKIKTCHTIAEWRRLRQAGNDAARAIAGENVCSGGECRGFEPTDAPE
jgi:hypothetical protein